jgi:peroxiredoxin
LLTSQSRETFAAIVAYARQHPQAPDHAAAVQWVFQTAPAWGWDADAIPLAEQVLQQTNADPELTASARVALCLGQASRGDAAAMAAWDDYLRSLRLRNPNAATDLAQSLAVRFQLRQDQPGAEAIYERLSTAFFLNAEVREFCEARRQRLNLVGQPAPALTVTDIDGRAVSWDDFRGKTVLLDFWATNCRPCLEELPRLKQLARELQPRGLELLGVSLDEDLEIVKTFRESQRLSWRMALDGGKVAPEFRVRLIPCVMLVDRAGRIAAVDVRPVDWRWTALRVLEGK